MYCSNCGHQIPDGYAFCPECGAPNGAPVCAAAPAAAAEPARLTVIKKHYGSDLAVVACSLLSAGLAVRLIGSSGELAIDVGSILLLIGAWLICVTCRRNDTPVKKGGFGVLRAYSILMIVCCSLLIFLGIICLAFCFAGSSILGDVINQSGYGSLFASSEITASTLLIIISASLVVVCAVALVFVTFIYRYTDSLHKLAKGSEDKVRYARFTEVMLYVMGIETVLSAFSSKNVNDLLSKAGSTTQNNTALMILAGLLLGAAYIIFAVIVGKAAKECAAVQGPLPICAGCAPTGTQNDANPQDGGNTPKYPSPQ